MIRFPFQFQHVSDSAGTVFTAESMDGYGDVKITWENDRGDGKDETTYSSADVYSFVRNGTWIVQPQKIDLRSALKIRLFEMRIADMEKSLAALKAEFEMHKQDVKGSH